RWAPCIGVHRCRMGDSVLHGPIWLRWSAMITLHSQVTAIEGSPVTIDCPACGAKNVPSRTLESNDWVKIAYLIPLLKLRSTRIECGQCKQQISCTAPLDRVQGQDAATIAPWLRYMPTAAARSASIVALLLS